MTTFTSTGTPAATARGRQMLNKVPEVTVWFWIIKILCTTVGESFADYINETLGFGLTNTTILFTVVFVVVLGVQMRLRKYVPGAYWLTVVVVSVAGTLYTDNLTDGLGVPLWISTSVFSVVLAAVFGVWYARERTLSIHSITTTPREAFYWVAVLATFALGTATGDWTLELTGWGPGVSILLPLALIALVAIVWKGGGNSVLTFWVAYILTRPLGANIGDFLSSPHSERGLALGTLWTSLLFLGAILATVVYLTVSRADVIEEHDGHAAATARHEANRNPLRERIGLAVLGAAAIATGALLTWANAQPHADALAAEEGPNPAMANVHMTSAQATGHFPKADVATFRRLVAQMRAGVAKDDQAAVNSAADAYEKAWDDDQSKLQPMDGRAWDYIDSQNDGVFTAVRQTKTVAAEKQALDALSKTLG